MIEFTDMHFWEFSFGDFVCRTTLPLWVASLTCVVLRRQSAAIRHWVWLLGLVATLVVPTATWCLPELVIPLWPHQIDLSASPDETATGRHFDAHRLEKVPSVAVDSSAIRLDVAEPGPQRVNADSQRMRTGDMFTIDVEQTIVFCWLIGIAAGLVAFLLVAARQAILVRRLPRLNDAQWQSAVAANAAKMGLTRCPKTVISIGNCVPSTTGIINPILVVPSDWRNWSSQQRDCILLHELAHIRRGDVATQCIARFATLVHWFNPFVWYAARQMRVERELASDDCVLQAGREATQYAEQLLTTVKQYRVSTVVGTAMASSARLDDRVVSILDPHKNRRPVKRWVSLVSTCAVGFGCIILGAFTPVADLQANELPSEPTATDWKQIYTVRYEKTMPVSVAFSPDGKRLLSGTAGGELMDLNVTGDKPTYNWRTNVGGTHPAVAFSLDGKAVYATTTDGVRILESIRGQETARLEEKDSQPITVDAFPLKPIQGQHSQTQIVFGNARGYFVKTWLTGHPDKAGTIHTSILAEGKEPLDEWAVPLAVDPKGRSAIMTGPIDGTGQVTGKAGENVLWAYVCGDYAEGSPGNRVMPGHTGKVVSAAWSDEGSVAVTGDASGCVIEWNATTMKETHRRELGGRVAALAISKHGRVAAYVLGKRVRVLVWNTDEPTRNPQVIYAEQMELSGDASFACLDFSPAGDRIAGCAGDHAWLDHPDDLIGRVHVWEMIASP